MLKIIFILLSLFFSTFCIANESVMQVVPVNNRPASELQSLISPLLESSERIIASHSSLIIKATPSRQKELINLIEQLDTRLSNLSITVIQSKTKTAQALNSSAKIKLNFPANKPSNISVKARGRFASTEGLNNSESRQKIQTLDGKPAYIKTGKIYPVENISIYQSGYSYPVISSNTQLIEASTGFLVTPRLSGNQVTIEVTPWSDKMNNNGLINSQSGHSTIRVNLGQWVEIGGIDEHSQLSTNRTLSHAYSTVNKNMRILIKVEKSQNAQYR